MSTLWTPGGEHPVGADRGGPPPGAGPGPAPGPGPGPGEETPDDAELDARVTELRRQLADTPAEIVVVNHCFGLFELAALHLSLQPPQLPQAQLAIDALGALVDGLAGRLGPDEEQLHEALTQLRLGYVQLKAAAGAGRAEAGSGPAPGGGG